MLAGAGCSFANTQLILDKMNSSESCPAPPRPSVRERVERIAFAAVADAYFDRDKVGTWLDAASANPGPIMALYHGLVPDQAAPVWNADVQAQRAFHAFADAVLPPVVRNADVLTSRASAWEIPAAAVCLGLPTHSQGPYACDKLKTDNPAEFQLQCPRASTRPAAACAEVPAEGATGAAIMWHPVIVRDAMSTNVDAERFVANVAAITPSLVSLREVADPMPTDAEVEAGIVAGLQHVKRYLAHRGWPRSPVRYRTALVLSGGAGTGAYEAGFVNRLLGVLQRCHGFAGKCNGAAVDLVVGTSTGSLVGFLVDLFHVEGKEQAARALLRDKYTCSVENDLYCAANAPIHKLGTTVRGLVKFDRIEQLLAANWTPEMNTNATELVTMSVDYESGLLFADSDQDPDDGATKEGRVQSVLASIVEPLMAYPVSKLQRGDGSWLDGTFIDGGIRSGLPAMQAMRRGAERVVTLSTASIDSTPIARPQNALSIVLRTIDLMVDQPRMAEPQQADLAAVARRMGEYNVCMARYQVTGGDALEDRAQIERFCRRTELVPTPIGVQSASAGWTTPGSIEQVARSWQSSWVYRSEKPIAGMSGYAFDPAGMRRLYRQGIEAFQARCKEILSLYSIPADVMKHECSADRNAVAEEEHLFIDLAKCEAKKREPRRSCEGF